MWREADPRVTFMLQASLRSFRHELLVANFEGIPVLQQHGGADNNVPAFHSRRMNQLISQSTKDSSHSYVELENEGHWFDGVMTSQPLRKFYVNILGSGNRREMPQTFSLVVTNPADTASRGGLVVDQLITPDQLGKVEVVTMSKNTTWVLRTSNISRLHFSSQCLSSLPHDLVIDGTSLKLPPDEMACECWFVRSGNGLWQVSTSNLK